MSEAAAGHAQPIDVHFWPTPNGWKVTIFLEEADVPYRLIPVNIGAGDQFTKKFIGISPNNRMPAIVDADGPGGEPIAVFETGAILQYLGRKYGRFYPQEERARVEVEQWLMWQMGGLGPMVGQANHFRNYHTERIAYATDRYVNEVNRLFGVLNHRLRDRTYVAGDYSIADMAIYPWVLPYRNVGQTMDEFACLKAWYERMKARPALRRAIDRGLEMRRNVPPITSEGPRAVLFHQRAVDYDALPEE